VIFPDEVHAAMQIRPFATRPPVRLPSGSPGNSAGS
jgi:hypothetical protein